MIKIKNNIEAFTLVESIVSILVISCVILLLMQSIISFECSYKNFYNEKNFIAFEINARDDFLESRNIKVGSTLVFNLYNKDTIKYIQVNNKLIREVNGKGGEVLLYNIKNINFTNTNNYIKVESTFLNNKIYKDILGRVF